MARLIESETENSSSITIESPTTTTSYEKGKMNSVNIVNTTSSPRKFSFKTKQHAYNHSHFQQKLVATKIRINQNSTVAELANKFNAIIVNDGDKISRHHVILKRKHSVDSNTIKDLPNTVKEAIRLFEQSNQNERNNNNNHNEGKTMSTIKSTNEVNDHLKNSSKIIVIRKNSAQKAKRISSTCESNNQTKPEPHNSVKRSEIATKRTSCKTCLNIPQLHPTLSMENIDAENNQSRRPFSRTVNLKLNSQKEWSKTSRIECENFLTTIKNNLRHTSMINLNKSSHLNDHSYQHKISDKDLINKFNLKPELKPKPEKDLVRDRRKSIADIQFVHKNNKQESIYTTVNVQNCLHKDNIQSKPNENGKIEQNVKESTSTINLYSNSNTKSNKNNSDKIENDFSIISKNLKNSASSIGIEQRKSLEVDDKVIKNNRLSIPKVSSELENILNHQSIEVNENITESEYIDRDFKHKANINNIETNIKQTNDQDTESSHVNNRYIEKINDNPVKCSHETDNQTTTAPSKPNNSFLWRSLSKETKSDNELANYITEDKNDTYDVNEKDHEIYTYIEINTKYTNAKEEIVKNTSSLHQNNHNSTTYQSLPNLNHSEIDDTYEELNYFSPKIYLPNVPEKKLSSSKNINEAAPKLPEKNSRQRLLGNISTITSAHPDINIDASKIITNVTKEYENKNLPDLLKRGDGENLYHEPQNLKPHKKTNTLGQGTRQILSNIDDKYATIVKPIKRDHGESNYNYESIVSIKDENHYISIQDDCYDDVLNVIQMDNCYESIKAASECGSFWEKDNSIYGIKAPSVLSNNSTVSTASGFNDSTSDEWVDVDQSDTEEHIFVYLPKKVSRSSMKKKGWIQKVRRQRSKLSNVRQILTTKKANLHSSNTSTENRSVYKTTSLPDHGHDSFSDSFDSDSDGSSELDSREPIHERSLPPPPPSSSSSAHLNQNIYGFVKEAGRQMKKHWSLSSLGLNKIRKMSVGAIAQLPGQVLPKPSEPDGKVTPQSSPLATTLPSRGRRWSSFKTKFRPHTTSTFYLDDHEAENTPPLPQPPSSTDKTEVNGSPPPLPEKDFRRKSIALGSLSGNERDLRRMSIALRPSSPPPPPPTSRTVSADESSLNLSNKSDKSLNSTSWYAESGLFDPTGEVPSYLDSDQIKHLPPQGSAYWENLWDSGNSSTPGATSNSDSMSDPGSDLHLRFIDEPLYQFYNSYIAELQFNEASEENGYEEIGSSPNRTSMLEIIAPSHMNRSLWCQLPEVIESGVLDTLDAGERKLQEAKFELITSEASYFKSLTVLEKHFIASPLLADTNVLGKNDRKHLFGNVTPVRKCSERLLAALEQCWQDSFLLTNICEIVYQHVTNKNFNIYIKYCSNQFHIDRTLKSLRETSPKFIEVLTELESHPVCQSLSLHSFLMLPMQRVTRLPLLFDAILTRLRPNHSEYETCHTALATLNKIVHECNEEARKMERYYEMLMLSRLIKFSLKEVKCLPVISSSRWLVRSGSLNFVNVDAKMTFSRKLNKTHFYAKLHLFLFTDLLVITKKKSNGSYSVIDYCTRAMMQMTALEDSMPPTNKYLMLLTILENHERKTVEIVLSCDTESGRQRWLEATAPPTSANPEETLYEQWDCPQVAVNHTYTAQQPDELNLQPGDVINVLRKMSDGWYQGERIRDGQKGWFPGNYTSEIASSHARAKNLKQRYRLLALSGSYLQSQELSKKKLT